MAKTYQTNQNALKVRLFRARQRMLKAFQNQLPGTERDEMIDVADFYFIHA